MHHNTPPHSSTWFQGLLQDCNQLCTEYLFQPDKHYDIAYDTGDKSIQCGQHVDVFKLWLMWKAKGSEGFRSQVNQCLENADYLFNKLENRADFELVFKKKMLSNGEVLEILCTAFKIGHNMQIKSQKLLVHVFNPTSKPEHSNVCFWYIPHSLRVMSRGLEWNKKLHEVAAKIKAKMIEERMVMVGYQPLGEKPNFFQCVFSNPATSREDVDFLVDEITRLGQDL